MPTYNSRYPKARGTSLAPLYDELKCMITTEPTHVIAYHTVSCRRISLRCRSSRKQMQEELLSAMPTVRNIKNMLELVQEADK